jgi:carbamoyltransferase
VAFYIWNQILDKPRNFSLEHAYWGPKFNDREIESILEKYNLTFKRYNNDELVKIVASEIANGKIVGWFQGRMEWGPRALGNRSILADPRREEMKEILNLRIKHREPFRPFAPSILEEDISEYLEINQRSEFMLLALPLKKEKLSQIPACTHIDGTVRFQSVSRKTNPLFWQLINEFKRLTGVSAVLNTSFNENEPIVCKPQEAIDCFLRTEMDVLVIGNYLIIQAGNQAHF